MAKEIEKKFLVDLSKLDLDKAISVKHIKQGYIVSAEKLVSRVRIVDNSKAYLTIKGKAKGISRSEFEYEIPLKDAEEMLEEFSDQKLIEKTRYVFIIENKFWEVDIFEGDNKGLVIAELELKDENELFVDPHWITEDISTDYRYSNNVLIQTPYTKWS